VTKHDLADRLRERSSLEKKQALEVIDLLLEEIMRAVDSGDSVELRGFGSFYREEKKQRQVFSPIAKKKIDVPARSVVVFKSSRMTDKANSGG
jgi:nucleoid DNA-binding protein